MTVSAPEPQTLSDFGWNAHFQAQLTLEELPATAPVRVMTVHRSEIEVAGPGFAGRLKPMFGADEETATVGDWLLLDAATHRPIRILERLSLLKRKAAGNTVKVQLIAANVDTLFIVTSCNEDFNTARLERYLALAREARVTPVVVLTKSDLAEGGAADYIAQAAQLLPGLMVEALDARGPSDVERLKPWCAPGQTIALVGSSGVGKSTLINSLAGADRQATQAIREDDGRGRHTTTARSLHRLPGGAWLMDTPGIRELQIAEVETGIREVFADIEDLAGTCRYANCTHSAEPDCAVRAAVEAGTLDPERLERRAKLLREESRNTQAVWERNSRDRVGAKALRAVLRSKRDVE